MTSSAAVARPRLGDNCLTVFCIATARNTDGFGWVCEPDDLTCQASANYNDGAFVLLLQVRLESRGNAKIDVPGRTQKPVCDFGIWYVPLLQRCGDVCQ